jgi:hypothetical protein
MCIFDSFEDETFVLTENLQSIMGRSKDREVADFT